MIYLYCVDIRELLAYKNSVIWICVWLLRAFCYSATQKWLFVDFRNVVRISFCLSWVVITRANLITGLEGLWNPVNHFGTQETVSHRCPPTYDGRPAIWKNTLLYLWASMYPRTNKIHQSSSSYLLWFWLVKLAHRYPSHKFRNAYENSGTRTACSNKVMYV